MKAIIKIVKSQNMLLDFFIEYMKLEHKCRVYETIIDDECMEYYYYEYKKFNYTDNITEEILKCTNKDIKFYIELKSLYEKRTKKKIKEYIQIDYEKIRKDSEEIFINSLFNKEDFIKLVNEFINEYGKDGIIELETLKNIRRYNKIGLNVKYKELLYFLCRYFKEEDKVSISSFDTWDWDFVILSQIYERINNEKKDIQLDDNQIEIIHSICNKGIMKCNFRVALKNNKINLKCLYYWFFRNKFDFEYPESTLLDMLEFEFSTNGKKVGIDYIVKSVDKNKVVARIIESIDKGHLYYQVFENLVEYCLNNNINNCCESIGKYLLNKKKFEFDRNLAAKYLVKFMKLSDFINKYFINLEIKMQRKRQKYII